MPGKKKEFPNLIMDFFNKNINNCVTSLMILKRPWFIQHIKKIVKLKNPTKG